ncbi:hypothetical protein LCGC14_1449320 [marine sediment metagenome]|uniref:Uncharacterized protein n=1 Tax=marine sediment metagenome TaxID=412755 RepID=A0A0F9MK70_9ZZZZ
MTQTWRDKEIKPDIEYDSNFKSAFFWGCDDGFTPLPVLINRCQNLIISKRCRAEDKEFDGISPVDDMRVYVNQKIFDRFIDPMEFNRKDYFTIEIDETVQDDMIIVSTLDQKYIEAVKIV